MLLTVIAHADSRHEAIDRLDAALADTVVLGVQTNAAFLRAILALEVVRSGDIDTSVIERSDLLPDPVPWAARALAAVLEHDRQSHGASLWTQSTGWRMGAHRAARYDIDGVTVAVARAGDTFIVDTDERTATVQYQHDDHRFTVHVDGVRHRADAVRTGDTTWVHLDGVTHRLRRRTRTELLAAHRAGLERSERSVDLQVRAVMPGTVVAVGATTGDSVVEGDPLVTIEAMKMEHAALASVAGTVTIVVAVGDQVRQDQVVAILDPHEGDPDE